ncbi:hemagglutinin repeat-containing protein [Herbaspirillum sp. NPDC101396]|uniref:two-partner secretion domain-containing protein n=1 Tax=Herbaspirillum sp. NPDC101396 TaxID=3364005 RepID=UPI00383B813C
MNKQAYRVIFNVRRGALMAVAENVSSQGKSPSECAAAGASSTSAGAGLMRLAQLGVMIAILFGGVTVVHGQIVADRNAASRPVVDQSANGKPVVQIVTPNAAGVSHNRYDQFNVGQGGAILNNSSTLTQTQQAGYIAGNAALTNGSARLILNEVTGSSRSQLNGYIEVAGQRAEVIVANPNGISCSGCGFINTSRGVLTTGTPEFAADGSLSNLRVTRGDITIDGSGMNGAGIDRVDLIARSVQVNGQLWGDQLNVVTGANLVNYANLGVQVIQGQGSAPTVSIDLAQLGGMYANKIRLIGTEAGVGVRSLGTIAAQAGDISIDNSGKVTLNGSTTASGNIAINSQGDVSNGGNLYAQQAVKVNAAGNVSNTGVLAAQTDVTVQARNITSSNSIAAGVDASGNAAANGNLSLTATAGIDNTGGNLYGRDTLTARAGADVTNNNGVIYSGNNVDISAVGALKNVAGRIEANNSTAALTLAAASLDNSGGRIANSGTGLTQIDGGAQIVNANAAQVANGGVIGGNGNVQLRSLALNNNPGGQILVGSDLSLQVSSLHNSGDISATRDLSIAVTNGFANSGTGSLNAVRNLTLTADSVDNKGLINSGATTVVRSNTTLNNTGRIYGEDVALGAQTFTNNVDNIAGVVAARNSMQIGAAQVTNSEHALLQSLGDMIIAGALDSNNQAVGNATSIINESATIDAGGSLSLQTASLINRNNHFSTTVQDDPALTKHVTEYAYWDQPDVWYTADRVTWSDSGDGGIVLVLPNGDRFEKFYKRDYTEVVQKTVVLSSDPGRISSGGNMLLSGAVTNDKSLMVAGGTLSGSVGAINNIGASGPQTTIWHMTGGENYYHWVDGHPHQNHYTYNQGGAAYDNVQASTTMDLSVASVQQNTVPTSIANGAVITGTPNAGNSLTAVLPHLTIPNNGLFTIQSQPGKNYLVETDPKFTDYKSFVSSDYMLGRLALDPQTIQKRLGDGFYEQKIIGDQITELTGKRTLGAYSTAEDQYKALMDAGVASAARFQLTPGIGLTDAQMAALTSDIVWLVDKQVTLPDGTQSQALVPVVYLSRVSTEDISPSGSLVSAKDINLTVNGSLNNGGMLLASNGLIVQATDIKNTGSIQSSGAAGTVSLTASNDVISSGSINGNRVGILAGRDVTLETTTASNMATDGLNTKVDRISSIDAGQLAIQAGRDVNLVAAAVTAQTDASLVAGRNLNISEVKTQETYNVTYDTRNHLNESSTQVVGANIDTGDALTLSAGQDINAKAVYANAGGLLAALAGHDINFGVARQGTSLDQAIYTTSKGLFNSSTSSSTARAETTTSIGSTLSGDSVLVQAGSNLNIVGSNIVGTKNVALSATDVTITTAQNTGTRDTTSRETTSGLMSSGFGVTLGSRGQDRDTNTSSTTNVGSTIGSVGGNVTIVATNRYTQIGSDVMAPGGDITIKAKTVDINAAYDTSSSSDKQSMHQSGLTLALTAPAISALQSVQQMSVASKQTNDPRMLAMAAATAANAIKDGYNSVKNMAQNPEDMSGVKITLSIGSSKSENTVVQTAEQAKGSNVGAGGNVNIVATGGGQQSNITAVGSNISGGSNVSLVADNQVNLLAAQNTSSQTSSNRSGGASLGIGFAMGGSQNGFTLEAGVNIARGNADGKDLTNVNTVVHAGNTATLVSGGDTNIKGANVSGNNVVANVGGDLNLESLQDTSKFDSKQSSAGLSVSLCIPPFCYGASTASGSLAGSKVNGDFASVTQQSGISAGDGGFQVVVSGNTDLKGAVIESTQKAIDDNKNSLTTGTLTQSAIQNRDNYDADGFSVSGSASGKMGDQSPTNEMSDKDKAAAKSPTNPSGSAGFSSESGSQGSTTSSGISGGGVTITNDTAQQAKTGQTAAETVANLNRDVNTDKDTSGALTKSWDGHQLQQQVQAQAQITQAFGQQASQAIGDYAASQIKKADDLRAQAAATGDAELSQQLNAQASMLESNWGPNGSMRLLAHTIVGGLTGGAAGAAGAAIGTLTAPNVALALQQAGIDPALSNVLTGIASTVAGAIVGGAAGAATALNEVVNNWLKHIPPNLASLSEQQQYDAAVAACKNGDASACDLKTKLTQISYSRDAALAKACSDPASDLCTQMAREASAQGNIVTTIPGSNFTYANSPLPSDLNTATIGIPVRPDSFQDQAANSTSQALLLEAQGQAAQVLFGMALRGLLAGKVGVTEFFASQGINIPLDAAARIANNFGRDGDSFTAAVAQMAAAKEAGWVNSSGRTWWPPGSGDVPGTAFQTTLTVGTKLDRYGGTTSSSSFLAPVGTSLEQRALSPGTNLAVRDEFIVIKPLPVEQSNVMPWFGQPGMGVQFDTSKGVQMTIEELVKQGYLKKVGA